MKSDYNGGEVSSLHPQENFKEPDHPLILNYHTYHY